MPTHEELLKDIEFRFQLNLDSTYRYWKRGWIDDEVMQRERMINLEWYHAIYSFLNPAKEVFKDELSQDLIDQYNTQQGFPLCSIIYYHDLVIPIYDDDAGQQVFAIINGHEISGGTYNFTYLHDFCCAADTILEKQQWARLTKPED